MSETAQRQMEYVSIEDLEYAAVRDIRPNVVSDIKDRIGESGYNPARPLRVVRENGHFIVADGNHRLKSLHELDHGGEIPCVIESEDADVHALAVASNRDEDTYAEMDLFDWLDVVDELRDGHTQAEIGEKIGWSRSKVSQYTTLLGNVATEVLELAREHQEGRVAEDATVVADFSERWFRDSGVYDLDDGHQQQFIEWFIESQNCGAAKSKVTRKAGELAAIQSQLGTLDAELNGGVGESTTSELREAVENGEYTDDTLEDAIEAANKNAKDRAYFGADAVGQLAGFDDNEAACVVTDPPYGESYESHRETDNSSFGEDIEDVLNCLEDIFEELTRVCKANAHIYVFFSTNHYHEIRQLAEQFFDVEPVPLVWVKNNHAPTQNTTSGFKDMYAQQYEPVFFCKMPNGDGRELNGSISRNVLEHDVPKGEDRWHDSQKPISLWEELITNSTGAGEVVLDPFAGSGSSLLAAKRTGRHYVGIEANGEYESRFKRELREIEGGDGGDSL